MACSGNKCADVPVGTGPKVTAANDEEDRTTVASSPALTITSIGGSEHSELKVPSGDLFALPEAEVSDSDGECEEVARAVRRWALAGSRRCPRSRQQHQAHESPLPAVPTDVEDTMEEEESGIRLGLAVRRFALKGAGRC